MNRHRVAIILALCAAAFSLTTFCHAQSFFDDFNRPDSANVGNGWSNTPGNTGNMNLRISNNMLKTPAPSPGGAAGIYRPFPFTAPLTVSATVTPGSGYGGSQLRYGVNFSVLNNGTMNSGYQLTISRADQNYNDSDVSLSDNGVVVGHAFSPFQYGPQLDVQATFSPDGSVIGRISEGADIFSFSFPPRTIQSTGANFELSMGGSDSRATVLTYATLDNLSLITTPSTSCQLNYTGFHQGDTDTSVVPTYYGNANARQAGDNPNYFGPDGRAMTLYYGCALCSVATMLTSVPGLASTTPKQLDAELKSTGVGGYENGDELNWCALSQATGYPIGLVDSKPITNLAVLDAYLQEHVCGLGDRVILHLYTYQNGVLTRDGHYVLVVGQNGSDWKLFDPGWLHAYNGTTDDDNLLTSLAAHYAGFTTHSVAGNAVFWRFAIAGVRTYRIGAASSAHLCGVVHSPVEVLTIDPVGNRIGYEKTTGNDVFEINDSSYVRDYQIADCDLNLYSTGDTNGIKTFCVPSPVGGTYQVQLIGTALGIYTLDIGTFWSGDSGQPTQTTVGTTDVGFTSTNHFFVIMPPSISGVIRTGNTLTFSFTTQADVMYSVESKTILSDAGWTLWQTITGTGGTVTVNNTNSANTQFYRVRAQ